MDKNGSFFCKTSFLCKILKWDEKNILRSNLSVKFIMKHLKLKRIRHMFFKLNAFSVSSPSWVKTILILFHKINVFQSFIIPVSVRVWDVNDNAPVWVGAPYKVRLSELTAVGSRILQGVRATDADQTGPHATIHYSVLDGPNAVSHIFTIYLTAY